MSFKDKVVLVTGGSSGIGASAALAFARKGARVAIVGRNEAKLGGVAEQCAALGAAPLVLAADVSRDADLRRVVDTLIRHYGRLDVLINNAGIVKFAKVGDEKHLAAFDEVMNTNLRAVVALTNLTVKHLIASKGNIINVSSVAAKSTLGSIGVLGYSSYCVSKAGLDHFTRGCALELAEHGVRVNSISPGPVDTPILEAENTKVDLEQLKTVTALKMITQPEEVANVMLFLASDKAKSITGSDYTIDAGFMVKS